MTKVDFTAVYQGFIQAAIEFQVLERLYWLRMKSDNALPLFSPMHVDLLHHDSNHSQLVSCREVEKWSRKVGAYGYWVFDDADWPSQTEALQRIEELDFNLVLDRKTYRVYRRKLPEPEKEDADMAVEEMGDRESEPEIESVDDSEET
jgi:hypothetical protein